MEILLSAEVICPWCGEAYDTTIDTSQEDFSTIEDCVVCCRPIEFSIEREEGGGLLSVKVQRID